MYTDSHRYEYIMNILMSVIRNILKTDVVTRFDYHDYVGKIRNSREYVCRNYSDMQGISPANILKRISVIRQAYVKF